MIRFLLALLLVCAPAWSAQLIIGVGSSANDGTGDTLRGAMQKINTNFTEVYGVFTNAQFVMYGDTNSALKVGKIITAGTGIALATNGNQLTISSTGVGTNASTVFVQGTQVDSPNFQNNSNALWLVAASTNVTIVVTNVSSSQLAGGIELSKLASGGANEVLYRNGSGIVTSTPAFYFDGLALSVSNQVYAWGNAGNVALISIDDDNRVTWVDTNGTSVVSLGFPKGYGGDTNFVLVQSGGDVKIFDSAFPTNRFRGVIQASNVTASALVMTDGSRYLTNVTLGSGLSLTNTTLSATGAGGSVYNNGTLVSNPNLTNSATAVWSVSSTTNLFLNPTNIGNAQITNLAGIEYGKLQTNTQGLVPYHDYGNGYLTSKAGLAFTGTRLMVTNDLWVSDGVDTIQLSSITNDVRVTWSEHTGGDDWVSLGYVKGHGSDTNFLLIPLETDSRVFESAFATNRFRGSIQASNVTPSSLLRVDANGFITPVTIGANISWDGTTLASTGGATNDSIVYVNASSTPSPNFTNDLYSVWYKSGSNVMVNATNLTLSHIAAGDVSEILHYDYSTGLPTNRADFAYDYGTRTLTVSNTITAQGNAGSITVISANNDNRIQFTDTNGTDVAVLGYANLFTEDWFSLLPTGGTASRFASGFATNSFNGLIQASNVTANSVVFTDGSRYLTNGLIANANVSGTADIALHKLKAGGASELLYVHTLDAVVTSSPSLKYDGEYLRVTNIVTAESPVGGGIAGLFATSLGDARLHVTATNGTDTINLGYLKSSGPETNVILTSSSKIFESALATNRFRGVIQASNVTANSIVMTDGSRYLTNVTIGAGLSFVNGTLSNSMTAGTGDVMFDDFASTQFGTNSGVIYILDGAVVTNLNVRNNLSVTNALTAQTVTASNLTASSYVQSDANKALSSVAFGVGLLGSDGANAPVDVDTLAEFDTAIGITGTPGTSNYWRGDNSWSRIALATDVTGFLAATNIFTNSASANNYLAFDGTVVKWTNTPASGSGDVLFANFNGTQFGTNGNIYITNTGLVTNIIQIIPWASVDTNINWVSSTRHYQLLTNNIAFTFSNDRTGGRVELWTVQDGTGARTISWPTNTWFFNPTNGLTTNAVAINTNANAHNRFVADNLAGTNYISGPFDTPDSTNLTQIANLTAQTNTYLAWHSDGSGVYYITNKAAGAGSGDVLYTAFASTQFGTNSGVVYVLSGAVVTNLNVRGNLSVTNALTTYDLTVSNTFNVLGALNANDLVVSNSITASNVYVTNALFSYSITASNALIRGTDQVYALAPGNNITFTTNTHVITIDASGAGGDNVTVSNVAATNPDFTNSSTFQFVLDTATTPDQIFGYPTNLGNAQIAANAAIAITKIATNGAGAGQILGFDGTVITWTNDATGVGGGDPVLVNGTAVGDAAGVAFTNSSTMVWALDTATTPDLATGYPTNLGAAQLATDSVSADELNVTGITNELSAVLDINGLQGSLPFNRLTDLTGSANISMGANNVQWSFPSSGNMSFVYQGTAGGHLLEIEQNTGNQPAGTHLLHIQGVDTDVIPLHVGMTNGSTFEEVFRLFHGSFAPDNGNGVYWTVHQSDGESNDVQTAAFVTTITDTNAASMDATWDVRVIGADTVTRRFEVNPSGTIVYGSEQVTNALTAQSITVSNTTASSYLQTDANKALSSVAIGVGLLGSDAGHAPVDVDTIGEFSTALGITGTPNSGTFLRGDGQWAATSGSGDVSYTAFAATQFGTNNGVVYVLDGAVVTNLNVRGNLTVTNAASIYNLTVSNAFAVLGDLTAGGLVVTNAISSLAITNLYLSNGIVSGPLFATTAGLVTNTGTIDGSVAGQTVKFKNYIQLTHPHHGSTSAVIATNNNTSDDFGHAVFADVDEANNFIEYHIMVPTDVDTSVAMRGKLKFKLTATDTGTHRFNLTMASVADSATADAPTLAQSVFFDHSADGSGADNDVETVGWVTLTNWHSNVTADQLWVIRMARDGNATEDGSTATVQDLVFTVEYGATQ